jgi:serine/threonine protein kinase
MSEAKVIDMVGRTISHYKLLEKLGAGGMGEIYKAQDTVLNRFVAIKVLSPAMASDPERRKRFFQEAQAASALNHPNIITIYDIVADGDTQCMVMEYIAGKTLREVIPPRGLSAEQALPFATQMAGALTAAHGAGIIHRDLKPSNVMVTGSGLIKILDFGLAKWLDPGLGADQATASEALTREGSIIGTMSYMSPEQAEGKRVDARTDIFSFGSVMYEMMTGRRAFEGTSGISTLTAILRDPVQPISDIAPGVPQELEQVILRCLPKDPEARWQSMKQVEAALVSLQRQFQPAAGSSPLPIPVAVAVAAPAIATPPPLAPDAKTLIGSKTAAAASPVTPPKKEPAPPPPPPKAAKPVPPPPAKPASPSKFPAMLLALLGIILIAGALVGGWLWWTNQGKTTPDTSAQVIPPTTAPIIPAPAPATPEVSQPAQPAAKEPPRTGSAKPTPFKKGAAPATPTPEKVEQQPQAAPPTPKHEKPAAPEAVPVTVGDALPFRIVLTESIPIDSQEGVALRFKAAEGLQIDGEMVIAKGATVTGSVIGEAGKKKFLGIGNSKMTFQLLQAETVDGKKITVRATAGRRKDGPTVRPFDTGKQSKSKGLAAVEGTEYIAYVDGPQTVSVRK